MDWRRLSLLVALSGTAHGATVLRVNVNARQALIAMATTEDWALELVMPALGEHRRREPEFNSPRVVASGAPPAPAEIDVPDDRASILARMIGRNYGGDEWSGVLRREVYFSQPDDPARAAEGRIIEKAFDGDSLVDTDYFSVEHGESRWGHLLDFGAKK